jgi:mannitol/fructose-specific phosphotransferase system IIA component (Ntr-type)
VHCRLDESITLDEALKALIDREELGSTAIGLGLALPHARIEKIREFSLVLGLHPTGVDFAAFDDEPVRVFTLILGPASEDDMYVRILSRTSRFLRDNRDAILEAKTPDDIYQRTLEY